MGVFLGCNGIPPHPHDPVPRSEPASIKSHRIGHERESTVHGSAHGVL